MRPRTRLPFDGKLMRHELGPLQMLCLQADASAAKRTTRLIEASDPDSLQVMLQVRGTCGITQQDRSALIPEGDLGSWHSSAPYVVEANAPFEIVIVTCPFALLTRQADRVRRQTAQRMDCSAGVGHLVRQYLAGLRALLEADACSEDACSHLAEGMLDLIRALYNSGRSPQPSASRSSQRLRAQIDRYIEDNLARPGLDRAMIARENFISRSYLDRLYHGDAGVSEAIREKRLDQVRRELADADLAALSVFAIALRWGFVSPSHFSRTFRAAYGQSPTAYRAALARRD